MPDLLLELFSEEIPARMQARAAEDLRKLVTDRLVDAGPGLRGRQGVRRRRAGWRSPCTAFRRARPIVREEKKGPRVGAPEQAIAGFLKAAGLTSIERGQGAAATRRATSMSRVIEKPGRAAIDVIGRNPADVIKTFPWPKSMRWGGARQAGRAATGCGRCIRSSRPSARKPRSPSRAVRGRRHRGRQRRRAAIASWRRRRSRCAGFDDYVAQARRGQGRARCRSGGATSSSTDAKQLAFAQGLELVEDEALLAEVAGLVEWPVVLMGSFDEASCTIPDEVIRATIRNNQKCFVLRDPHDRASWPTNSSWSPISRPSDGGKAIVAGNERVIRARLSDAKFFYETDLKTRLEDRLPKFEQIVFHEKLGTQARAHRAHRAARRRARAAGRRRRRRRPSAPRGFARPILLTEVVGEFPELQGLMGKYYAEAQGEDEAVAARLRGSLQAEGSGRSGADRSGVGRRRARRQDRHAGRLLGIDEKPTGSKGPIRAATGGAGRG